MLETTDAVRNAVPSRRRAAAPGGLLSGPDARSAGGELRLRPLTTAPDGTAASTYGPAAGTPDVSACTPWLDHLSDSFDIDARQGPSSGGPPVQH